MITVEKELQPGYEWELDFHCERCGATHDLIFDKATEKMFCAHCLRFVQGGGPSQADSADYQE